MPGPHYSYTYTITSWLNRKKLIWEIHAQAVYTDGQKPTEETEYTARVRRGTKSSYIDIPTLQHEWRKGNLDTLLNKVAEMIQQKVNPFRGMYGED
jgi:hypothetical protein